MAEKRQFPKRTKHYESKGHLVWDETLEPYDPAVLYEKDAEKRTAYITLNRPDKLNYLERETYHDLLRIMNEVEADDDIKVVVLRGAGPCFTTGENMADLGFIHGIQQNLPGERRAPQRARIASDRFFCSPGGVLDRWCYLLKFTVLQAHSYCIGMGMWFAIASDFVIASEDAVFGHPAYRWVGASVDGHLTHVIMHVGPKIARRLAMLGVYLTAQEAFQAGMISEVVPREQLEKRVDEYSQACALQPLDGIVTSKMAFEAAEAALGLKTGRAMGPLFHTVNSNIRFEPDEWSFFRDRRDRGFKASMRERDLRWEKLPGFGFPFRSHKYQTTKTFAAKEAYTPFKVPSEGGEQEKP